jgi:hypothetical protein
MGFLGLLLNGLFVVRFLPLIGYGGNGDGFLVTIPIPVVPDGYEFFPVCIPMGTKSYPNPAPKKVFTRRVSGIGYPLTSLRGGSSTPASKKNFCTRNRRKLKVFAYRCLLYRLTIQR